MRLETFLQDSGIGYEKTAHIPTYTAQDLASQEHVSGYNVAKPVVVKSGDEYAMCVIPACARLDLAKVADVLGPDEIRMASEEEMLELFPDCELGAEPPIGKLFGLRTVADARLRDDEFLLMQTGKHTEAIRVNRQDWERLCQPVMGDITETPRT